MKTLKDHEFNFAAELVGLPYLPAFADPSTTGRNIINGVNFASAAAGILDQSGQTLVLLFPVLLYSINVFCSHIYSISIRKYY